MTALQQALLMTGRRDPYFSNVVLLLHSDTGAPATFYDSSVYHRTMTPTGTAALDAADLVAGNASALFLGGGVTDGVMSATSPDFAMGSAPFTVEGAFKFLTNAATPSDHRTLFFLGHGAVIDNTWLNMYLTVGSFQEMRMDFLGTAYSMNVFTILPVVDTWYRFAFCADGSFTRTWVGLPGNPTAGIALSSGKGNQNAPIPNSFFYYGGHGGLYPPAGAHCRLDEFRVTKGIARYDLDDPTVLFDPVPFPNF